MEEDNEDREVAKEEGQKFMEKYGMNMFIETSAKSGYNVETAF